MDFSEHNFLIAGIAVVLVIIVLWAWVWREPAAEKKKEEEPPSAVDKLIGDIEDSQ